MTQGSRINVPPLENLDASGIGIYQQCLDMFGGPFGPRPVLLNTPKVAESWSALANSLFDAEFSPAVRELTILIIAEFWQSDFEWYAHEPLAIEHGLSQPMVEQLRSGVRPLFEDPLLEAVYDFVSSLQRRHGVDDDVYDAVRRQLGDRGTVELTVLAGHFTSVAMTLNAHRVPLPPGVASPFAAQNENDAARTS